MSFPGSILLTDKMIHSQSETKQHPLGTRGYTTDGRAFRYALNGAAALQAGDLVTGCIPKGLANSTAVASTGTTGYTSTWSYFETSCTWAAACSVTANTYADGYAWTQSTDGAGGQMVKILSNTTQNSSDTSVVARFNFYPDSRWTDDFDSETRVALIQNQYYGVITIPGASSISSVTAGVAPLDVTASYYFWLQTWGPAAAYCNGTTPLLGTLAWRTTSTGLDVFTTGAEILSRAPVGIWASPAEASANEFILCNLTIEP